MPAVIRQAVDRFKSLPRSAKITILALMLANEIRGVIVVICGLAAFKALGGFH